MRNLAPWTAKILDMLSDGEWHEYNEILAEVMPLVPPNRAWRKAEKARLGVGRAKNPPPPERKLHKDKAFIIRVGQRLEVARSLTNLRSHGRVEVEYEMPDTKRKIRRVRATGAYPEMPPIPEHKVWTTIRREARDID